MKKNHFLLAMAVAGIALFSSCSQNEDVSVEDESVQLFTIQVASSGDGLQTRAGRPLYASDANQDIQNVKVMIKANDGTVKYANLIENWQNVSSPYTQLGNGRQYTLALKGPDKLTDGTYTIVAVGYSTDTDYGYSPDIKTLAKGGSLASDITATYAGDAEEVFAGQASVTVANDSFEPVTVTLHRQVAGALGYFTKIPAKVGETAAAKLRLVTRSKNTTVAFNNFNSTFEDTGIGAKYIVNGSVPAAADAKFNGSGSNDGNVLYTINLSDWFTGLDTNADGILDENDTWKHPASVETVVTKGSVFSGKFIIPFALTTGKRTMELQLLDASDNVLKSWGVNIPTTDRATGKISPEVNDESVSIFNIVRNHMYNLGVKTDHTPYKDDDNNGENDDPSNPDPDPNTDPSDGDDPQDLSKTQELILKVNDNWELIHKMELE